MLDCAFQQTTRLSSIGLALPTMSIVVSLINLVVGESASRVVDAGSI